jgi:hypothetical protein
MDKQRCIVPFLNKRVAYIQHVLWGKMANFGVPGAEGKGG